jgi:hypothetical protein
MSCPLKAQYPASFSIKQNQSPQYTVVAAYGGAGYSSTSDKNALNSQSAHAGYRTLGNYMNGGNCCQPFIAKLCGSNCGK